MSRIVILGATGTLGKALINRLLERPENQILCVSRNELNQKETKREFNAPDQLQFVIGDIRDKESLYDHFNGADTVFHVAALKDIAVCNDNPDEALKTNVEGTRNVADASIRCGVKTVVFSSTDKAVDPSTLYGYTKAASESLLLQKNKIQLDTRFVIYRWGNVVGSRGSVLKIFADKLLRGDAIPLTHPSMSRFWIKIEDAVDFMLKTYETAECDYVQIPSMKASSLVRFAEAVAGILGVEDVSYEITGIREGEKLHEHLISQHSICPLNSRDCDQYSDQELTELLTPILEKEYSTETRNARAWRQVPREAVQ